MRLESVQIGVPDPDAAAAAYALLLDTPGAPCAGGGVRFSLARGAVELEPGDGGLRAMRFLVDAAPDLLPGGFHGPEVRIEVCAATHPGSPPAGTVEAIDHIVVQSLDPERAIALWRDRMGLRLALDRVFPERGLRLVFFRSGGITLEYACSHPPPGERAAPDRYYGLSYRVRDLASHRERLLAAGLDVSSVRVGLRPGTSVVTVRSGTAGVPTLLLQIDAPSPGFPG